MRSVLTMLMVSAVAGSGVLVVGAQVAATGESFDRVVTLGDSYGSGTGIHADASDYDDHGPARQSFDRSERIGHSACLREVDDTPGPRLADKLGSDSVFVACAGAVISEISNQVAAAAIPGTGNGTLVNVIIGGNDLRSERGEKWANVLVRCITSSRCDRSDDNQLANLDSVHADLLEVYTDLGEEYPDVSVRVLGYPRLMQSDRWCEGVTGVSRAEADWIDDQVDIFNARIGAAASLARVQTGADIRFVSVTDEFDNHGACRFWQRDRYVNDLVFGETLRRSVTTSGVVRNHWNDGLLNISSSSFHPSKKGYNAYFEALAASLPAFVNR
jgi:lysophospholipase L1-like esterase